MKLKNKILGCLITTIISTTSVKADVLSDYAKQCKVDLYFDSFPRIDCAKEQFRFATGNNTITKVNYGDFRERNFSLSDDFVAHKAINSNVDAVFACRWVQPDEVISHATSVDGSTHTSIDGTGTGISGELIIHNRENGRTCFFDMKTVKITKGTIVKNIRTTNPVPPDDKNASDFWEQPKPIELDGDSITGSSKVCTECHSAGPYIASNEIVGALAKFGLINDKHDIQGKIYSAVTLPNNKYLTDLNTKIKSTIQPITVISKDSQNNKATIINSLNTCTTGCHVVGGYFPDGEGVPKPLDNDRFDGALGNAILIPSINLVIDDVVNLKKMPPQKNSDYFSINRDTQGATGDHEILSEAQKDFPNLHLGNNPVSIEAHTVDSSIILKADANGVITGNNKLNKFNLLEGLLCLNSENTEGVYPGCRDWQTRYKCGTEWTEWRDVDAKPKDGIEDESRTNYEKAYNDAHANDSPKKTFCSSPTYIQARYRPPATTPDFTDPIYGPRDILRQFNNKGLRCFNEDQKGGTCHNYVVKFIYP